MPPALTIGAWLRHDLIMEHVDALSPRTVIEFGPGLGAMGSRLAARADYHGVELDPVSREHARQLLGADRVVESLDDIPGDAVDLVCAFEVLEHIEDDREALRQWRKLLVPGGHVLLSVPAHSRRFGPSDEMAGHFRRYDAADLVQRFEAEGFVVSRLDFTGFPIGYGLEWGRNTLARRMALSSVPIEERTGGSGRLFQPKRHGWATRAVSWPFRRIQPYVGERGTSLVVLAESVG